jgi:ATP-dependent Lon protease
LIENGLRSEEIAFTEEGLLRIIRSYTREAGVRNLEREIGSICRKIVTKIAEAQTEQFEVTAEKVTELLGRQRYFRDEEIIKRTSLPGVATGLAWTPVGGDILFIEATSMPGSKGFQITGSIGNVMQESARAALSYIRSKAPMLGLSNDFFEKSDFHVHVPAGAQPKDGPSAGTTIAVALASLISGRPVRANVGMTGEISLRGQVLPVGGIKEKVLAAHRSCLKTVILPAQNEADLEDVPDEVRQALNFVFVETVEQVLEAALEPEAIQDSPAKVDEQPSPENQDQTTPEPTPENQPELAE